MSEVLSKGLIKWFNKEKGYGFVATNEGSFDVFIHAKQLRLSGIERPLLEGEKISFIPSKGPKGPFATNISLEKE